MPPTFTNIDDTSVPESVAGRLVQNLNIFCVLWAFIFLQDAIGVCAVQQGARLTVVHSQP